MNTYIFSRLFHNKKNIKIQITNSNFYLQNFKPKIYLSFSSFANMESDMEQQQPQQTDYTSDQEYEQTKYTTLPNTTTIQNNNHNQLKTRRSRSPLRKSRSRSPSPAPKKQARSRSRSKEKSKSRSPVRVRARSPRRHPRSPVRSHTVHRRQDRSPGELTSELKEERPYYFTVVFQFIPYGKSPMPGSFSVVAPNISVAQQQLMGLTSESSIIQSTPSYKWIFDRSTKFRYFHKKNVQVCGSLHEMLRKVDYKRYGLERGGVMITFAEFDNLPPLSPPRQSSSYTTSVYLPPVQQFRY
jgi:hypothetical protein